MFFEGAEKKLEIRLTSNMASLRQREYGFWSTLVACANAEILSTIRDPACDAYLLSESSLFVWDDKILLLTCGNCTLIEAACYFINALGVEHIAALCYQRKNEYQAQLQSTHFADDIAKLRTLIPGKAFRIGHLDSHHHYLFCTDGQPMSSTYDTCLELMMYHIRGELADYLKLPTQTEQGIYQRLGLQRLFPDFQFDMHCFQPSGFSLNGISGADYVTLHITPSIGPGDNSYVSFETNLDLAVYPYPLVAQMIKLFMPSSWDLIRFNQSLMTAGFPEHVCLAHGSIVTEQGCQINFNHYQQLQTEELLPVFL
ncbi:adenosylmethionine decarboxylase [Shewanella xiamenensis]|uniref:adenosylmethionine decarboxylase n=1 Tax=Shewanella xiamenensis TaxID=332186 RepID=UPI0011847F41|nr:adenosylmethionine decarboxylase [Shewanella xiamenensis]TVL16826.1 adenosylmethionine decarboxylase [Shewanella xiamenensis]TVL17532.1 adenosylmethionine decarboxylase [Shewanella xiamenensis]TVL25080.1 adenosylmethionine decarboxylase [Shewanella xiamenensis]TVL30740.1 adenosylmethionine decarboxylase [Shewanella xiamenensis]TVP00407.1 adenosylmethionine decarboxylase [Shewanella xiamenensis]